MKRERLAELAKIYREAINSHLDAVEQLELLNAVDQLLTRVEVAGTRAGDLNRAAIMDCKRITDLRMAITVALANLDDLDAMQHPESPTASRIRSIQTDLSAALEIDSRPASDPADDDPDIPICHICRNRWRSDDPQLLKVLDLCVRCGQRFCEECHAERGVCKACRGRRNVG